MKTKLASITLFLAALLAAMALGGSLYEALVVYPAWSASPPASLALLQGPHAVDSTRFWILVHVAFEVALLAALALNWRAPRRRAPLLAGLGVHIVMRAWTFAYFVPEVLAFTATPPDGPISAELAARVSLWGTLAATRAHRRDQRARPAGADHTRRRGRAGRLPGTAPRSGTCGHRLTRRGRRGEDLAKNGLDARARGRAGFCIIRDEIEEARPLPSRCRRHRPIVRIVDMIIMSMYIITMREGIGRVAPTTGYLIWRVLLKWRASMDRALAPLGLTHAQYSLLASLYGLSQAGRRPSQRELADFSGLEPVFISRLARALEKGGLVERDPHPADPRAVQLRMTQRGLEVVTAAIRVVRGLEEQQLAPLGGRSSPRSAELRDMLRALLSDTGKDDVTATHA